MTIAPTNLQVQIVDGTTVKTSWKYTENSKLVGDDPAIVWAHHWSNYTFQHGDSGAIPALNGSGLTHSHSDPHIEQEIYGGGVHAGGAKPVVFPTPRNPSEPNALRSRSTTLDNTNFGSFRQQVQPTNYRAYEGQHIWQGFSVWWDYSTEQYTPEANQVIANTFEQGAVNFAVSLNSRGFRRQQVYTTGAWDYRGTQPPLSQATHCGRWVDVIYHAHFHPTVGALQVWFDGEKIFDEGGANFGYKTGGNYFLPKLGSYGSAAKNAANNITNTELLGFYSAWRIAEGEDKFDVVAPSPNTGFLLRLYENGSLIQTINSHNTDRFSPATREWVHTVTNTTGKTYTAEIEAERFGVYSSTVTSVEGPEVNLPLVVDITEPADLSNKTFTVPATPQIDDLLLLFCCTDGTVYPGTVPEPNELVDVTNATFTRLAADTIGADGAPVIIPDETANGFLAWRKADVTDVGIGSYTIEQCASFQLVGILLVRISGIDWDGGSDPWAGTPARLELTKAANYTGPTVTTTLPDAIIVSAVLNVGSWQPGSYPYPNNNQTSADSVIASSGRVSVSMSTKVVPGTTAAPVWTGLDATTSGAKLYTLAIRGTDNGVAPSWATVPQQNTVTDDGAVTLDVAPYVADSTGAGVTFSNSQSSPAGATFGVDSAGVITLSASPTAGTYTVTVDATNSKGTTTSPNITWVITDTASADPVITLEEDGATINQVTGEAQVLVNSNQVAGTMAIRIYETDPGAVTAADVYAAPDETKTVVAAQTAFQIPNIGWSDTDYIYIAQEISGTYSNVQFVEISLPSAPNASVPNTILGNESDKLVLDVLLKRMLTDRDADLQLGLFTNANVTETTTLSQITEPSGGGYARKTLTDADWSGTNPYTYAAQDFVASSDYPEPVYGYFVCTKSSGGTPRLLLIAKHDTPVTLTSGATHQVNLSVGT